MIRLASILLLTATLATAREFPAVPLRPCDWCGETNLSLIQGHHAIPQATCIALGIPELLKDPRNCVMLCADDHLLVGHLGNWNINNTQLAQMIKIKKRKPLKPLRTK